MTLRVGQGFDCHAFADDPARPLMLGGIEISNERGLAGHSDADVATHALMDALLGAACLGDLGRHFPATEEHRDASSLAMLETVLESVLDQGWTVTSADVTIIAQAPRLEQWLPAMADLLGDHLGIDVSVKATTTDRLGAIGRGEGICSFAIVLLEAR